MLQHKCIFTFYDDRGREADQEWSEHIACEQQFTEHTYNKFCADGI
jgi:hypothetical protein